MVEVADFLGDVSATARRRDVGRRWRHGAAGASVGRLYGSRVSVPDYGAGRGGAVRRGSGGRCGAACRRRLSSVEGGERGKGERNGGGFAPETPIAIPPPSPTPPPTRQPLGASPRRNFRLCVWSLGRHLPQHDPIRKTAPAARGEKCFFLLLPMPHLVGFGSECQRRDNRTAPQAERCSAAAAAPPSAKNNGGFFRLRRKISRAATPHRESTTLKCVGRGSILSQDKSARCAPARKLGGCRPQTPDSVKPVWELLP